MHRILLLPLLAVLASGCERLAPRAAVAEPAAHAVVDSAMPIEEALRRFRDTLPGPPPASLAGGAGSLEELFRTLVRAYGERDAAALEALAITPAEFAWLYYPDSPYPAEPYRLQPEFLWYLVEERGAQGVRRAVERFGGTDAGYASHACPAEPREEGGGLLHGPCFVTVRVAGREEEVRLANAVLERDGRFKLVGFDNRL